MKFLYFWATVPIWQSFLLYIINSKWCMIDDRLRLVSQIAHIVDWINITVVSEMFWINEVWIWKLMYETYEIIYYWGHGWAGDCDWATRLRFYLLLLKWLKSKIITWSMNPPDNRKMRRAGSKFSNVNFSSSMNDQSELICSWISYFTNNA